MVCRGPVGGGGREPVLLVHGTFVTAAETFGWSYLPDLAARGYRVCTVDLPNRSLDDIQIAAESVVVAVHRLARESGRKVDVISHSQGVLEARWAVRWWPSVQGQVDDLVSLAGPNQGTSVSALPVSSVACRSCVQMAPGSAFLRALNAGDQSPGPVSYTAVYSTLVDELITPNATAARIDGASNIELQALCPGRIVDHVSILADAVAHALVLDALDHPGPATVDRFNRSLCLQATYVGLPGVQSGLGALLTAPRLPTLNGVLVSEPPLRPYAQPAPPAPASSMSPPSWSPLRPSSTAALARTSTSARGSLDPPPAGAAMAHAGVSASVTSDLRVQAASASRRGRGAPLVLLALGLVLAAGATGGVAARRFLLRSPGASKRH